MKDIVSDELILTLKYLVFRLSAMRLIWAFVDAHIRSGIVLCDKVPFSGNIDA